MANAQHPWPNDSSDRSELLTMYQEVFAALRHEGNGIWERFNILVGVNLALFAALGLLCFREPRPAYWRGFGASVAAAGIILGLWSLYVLRRLWERHAHWRRILEEMQAKFPTDWPKPIDSPGHSVVLLTEPYLLIFLLAWVALFAVLLACPGAFAFGGAS